MKKIITFGELLLRFSTNIGERLFQTDQIYSHFGGAEANVAISLAKFGHKVYFVSKVPKNPLGYAAEKHLKTNGVHTDYLRTGGDRLGTYYVESGVGPRSAQVVYDRKYSSISQLALRDVDFEMIFSGAALYHVSGITPALSPSLKETVLYSLQKAKQFGVTTSFDFNYRATLWSQQEAAIAFQTFLPYVDICSCGELDARYLLGIEPTGDTLEKREQLAYYYQQIQLMYPNIQWLYCTFRDVISASTNILQGNIYTNGTLYQSKMHPIDQMVDRVGGGDAFAAGILHGIMREWAPEEIAAFATAASVLKHTIRGDYSNFTESEIRDFIHTTPGKIVR